jgi:hypothetical protein
MADHHGTLDAEVVQQLDDVAGEVLDQVAALRLRRVAVASLGDRDGSDVVRQVRQHQLERARGVGHPVQHQDGDAGRVALLDVGERSHGRTPVKSRQTFDTVTRATPRRTITTDRH